MLRSATPNSPCLASPRRARLTRAAMARGRRGIDLVAALAAAALLLAGSAPAGLAQAPLGSVWPVLAAAVVLLVGLRIAGCYCTDTHRQTRPGDDGALMRAAMGLGGGLAACLGLALVLGATDASALRILATPLGVIGAVLAASHGLGLALAAILARAGLFAEPVVIVGASPRAQGLIERAARGRDLDVLAIFDDRAARRPQALAGVPVVGGVEALLEWPRLPEASRIVIALDGATRARTEDLLARLRTLPNQVVMLVDLDGLGRSAAALSSLAGAPVAGLSGAAPDLGRAAAKRAQDLVVGALLLVAFAPLMALIALAVKLQDGGPVFFRQDRHGFNNRIIRVWKFRSMHVAAAETRIRAQVVAGDPRVTSLGRFLRRTSLDELPQLFNVLAGEMSLVGPRPHAVGMRTGEVESHRLVADYSHRHRMKPGLTGWAQVNGSRGPMHTAAEVRQRIALDLEYIDRQSLWFDLWIMLCTAPALLGDARRTR